MSELQTTQDLVKEILKTSPRREIQIIICYMQYMPRLAGDITLI